ncbi:MAG: protein-L-isoaspartate O-methyltransferase [Hydrogenophilales bacterium 16-64-46]|nr:MAG: protein-L-isoaspartate O-methyltransferase [Hydrogenophilales bacterium 12-64-13]OYZ06891.1 MAG: protein-L-isoaspartate O-methyltransferase [Hydrogenophilales bacterium 16-64-46]OZA37035.1 MAG: protein-L-isoaspartate O-methyltransferase [Hydrogenophilales bacterium 17-64-34]HQS99920.1 protein-L-isoaspartate O-methyltransferase [Thiobacillus sp.]
MDIEQARYNMVEQQIRPWDVLNQSVLDLLFRLRREDFVPPPHRALAFVDMEIPLGHGEAMWTPKLEARVLQELTLSPADRVLEIGTGSGYFTALLAAQAAEVVSVDIHADFSSAASASLRAHGIANVNLQTGDAARDWYDQDGFDAIVLTGSTPLLSDAFRRRLRVGGRLFAITGTPPVMQAQLVTCTAPGAFRSVTLFETCVAPLLNAPQPAAFVF